MLIDNGKTELWVLGHRVTPMAIDGRIAMVEVVVTPGLPGPPPHLHEDAAEFFLVLDGRLEVEVGSDRHTLGAGDYLVVPRAVVHTFRELGSEPARFLTGWEPQGFEQFFLDCGIPVDTPRAHERSTSQENIPVVMAAFDRRRATIVQQAEAPVS